MLVTSARWRLDTRLCFHGLVGEQLARDALADGVGFVVIDAAGTIRVQRVDIQFGQHAPQILDMLRRLN